MKRQQIGLRRKALSLAVTMALAGAAHAQISTATVRGAVASGGQATGNAEVVATNVNNGYTTRTRTNADGSYVLTSLPPGDYRIKVTAGDKVTERTVTLQVGQTASLDLPVEAAGADAAAGAGAVTQLGTVTVTGAAAIDKTTSEVGTYVTPQQLQRLPQVSRNFLSQADLAPGVNVTYDGEGNVTLRSGAGSRGNFNVFIDGVSQKDYVMRGGITGQDRSRGNPFPQSALAEYKVITQNYKAEFDQVSGAAITALTKSGTNEFHGDAFVDYTSYRLRAKTPKESADGLDKTQSNQKQYGISAGGPIVKDKVHFFVAYEGKRNEDPFGVTAGGGYGALLPPAAQAELGSVLSPFQQDLFFGKIDTAIDDNNRVEFSLKYRKEADRKHVGNTEAPSFGSDDGVDEKRWDLKHTFNSDRWTNEARVTYEDAFFFQQPVSAENGARYRYVTGPNGDQQTDVLNTGGNNYYQRKGQKGFALQNDTTWTGLASHILKGGAKVKRITIDALEQSNSTPQYYYDIAPGGPADPYKFEFGVPLAGVGEGRVKGKNTQFGIYLQDDWEVNKKLTLNLGARYDIEQSPLYTGYRTPDDVVAALNAPDVRPGAAPGQTYAQSLANGGVDINNYISTGNNRKNFKNAFQPRLGFAYDINGDKQHVVFGGFARSYDRNVFDIMQLERTKGTYPNVAFDIGNDANYNGADCGGRSNCIPAWDPRFFDAGYLRSNFAGSSNREVNLLSNNLKTPYSDQLSLGWRDSIGEWQTEVSVAHIKQKDMFVFLLGNRQPDGSFYVNDPGSPPSSPFGFGIPGLGSLILGTNGLQSKTNALYLKLDKPYTPASGWGATFAYTFSDVKENHNLDDDFTYSLDQPTIGEVAYLRSTVVARHKLVATGNFDLPYDAIFAAKLTLASPKAIRSRHCEADPGVDACRTDVVDAKSFRQFDVSLSKLFNIGWGMKLGVRADVLNLFNYKNFDDYDVAWASYTGPATITPQIGRPSGPPRTFKLGMNVSW